MLTILAGTKKNQVDDRLKEIAAEVQKKHKELKGFALPQIERVGIVKGKTHVYPLVDKEVVEVTINEKPDEKGRVTLTIKPPKISEIKYACCCGKYFPIITDYYTANGDRLIIAIMAKPCMKKKP